jgi:hypothetical protein
VLRQTDFRAVNFTFDERSSCSQAGHADAVPEACLLARMHPPVTADAEHRRAQEERPIQVLGAGQPIVAERGRAERREVAGRARAVALGPVRERARRLRHVRLTVQKRTREDGQPRVARRVLRLRLERGLGGRALRVSREPELYLVGEEGRERERGPPARDVLCERGREEAAQEARLRAAREARAERRQEERGRDEVHPAAPSAVGPRSTIAMGAHRKKSAKNAPFAPTPQPPTAYTTALSHTSSSIFASSTASLVISQAAHHCSDSSSSAARFSAAADVSSAEISTRPAGPGVAGARRGSRRARASTVSACTPCPNAGACEADEPLPSASAETDVASPERPFSTDGSLKTEAGKSGAFSAGAMAVHASPASRSATARGTRHAGGRAFDDHPRHIEFGAIAHVDYLPQRH